MKIFKQFKRNESGQAIVEYVMILVLVSVVAIGALGGIGDGITDTFDKVVEGIGEIVGGGETTLPADFIPVATAEELDYLRENKEQTFGKGTEWEGQYTSGLDKKYIQVKDIDLSSIANFTPIGKGYPQDFKGVFDGGGHTISNLKVDIGAQWLGGLFGLTSKAKLENINLVNIDVKGQENVGGLVGWQGSSSEVINCYATGKVTGNLAIGGLVGVQTNTSKIIDSHAAVEVNGHIDGNMTGNGSSIGGLLGTQDSNSEVIKSYATGNVVGRNQVGGLVGRLGSATSVIDSYATGDVSQNSFMLYTSAGGLVGHAGNAYITNSYATGKVVGSGYDIGGLVGDNYESSVINSYYDRTTTGQVTSGGGTGKTTAQMKDQSTYNGWDFDNIWKIETDQYPKFQ